MGDVTRFRQLKWRAVRPRSPLDSVWLPLAAFCLSALVGWSILTGSASRLIDWLAEAQPIVTTPSQTAAGAFTPCHLRRGTCVVDGDTIDIAGIRYRIADIDTPEIFSPACAAEKRLGDAASARLLQLLNAGPFDLLSVDRDEDDYGRKLRILSRDGRSIGEQLVAEQLAHRWDGRKHPWC